MEQSGYFLLFQIYLRSERIILYYCAHQVFNAQTGVLAYNLQGGSNVALPTTAIRFRPVTVTTRTKNVFIASNAAGTVFVKIKFLLTQFN